MEESIIIAELLVNKRYMKRVLPYIKVTYFDEEVNQKLFGVIKHFIVKYRKMPSLSAIAVEVGKLKNLTEQKYNDIIDTLNDFKDYKSEESLEWLVDNTEEFCLRQAVGNALMESSEINADATDIKKIYGIRGLIDEALSVNFNRDIGIEYFNPDDIKKRWDSYTKKKVKYPTHIKKLNYLTGGGLEEKKIHVFFGDTHVGKTMTLTALAAGFVKSGQNVLYVTLEMSKEDICKLVDANYTDIKINDIAEAQTFEQYSKKLDDIKNQKPGRFFAYEFPTGNAGTNSIRALLDDLRHKKGFVPHIIIVDYINLMRCDRYSDGNSYTTVKGITEELRGLAVEGPYCVVSATQTNRQGAKNSEPDMTDTAESYGLPQTVDLLVSLFASDAMKEENLMIMKCLKNRIYGITNYKFPVKTMFEYARLVDCDRDHDEIIQNNERSKSLMEKASNKDKLAKLKVNIDKKKESDLFDD